MGRFGFKGDGFKGDGFKGAPIHHGHFKGNNTSDFGGKPWHGAKGGYSSAGRNAHDRGALRPGYPTNVGPPPYAGKGSWGKKGKGAMPRNAAAFQKGYPSPPPLAQVELFPRPPPLTMSSNFHHDDELYVSAHGSEGYEHEVKSDISSEGVATTLLGDAPSLSYETAHSTVSESGVDVHMAHSSYGTPGPDTKREEPFTPSTSDVEGDDSRGRGGRRALTPPSSPGGAVVSKGEDMPVTTSPRSRSVEGRRRAPPPTVLRFGEVGVDAEPCPVMPMVEEEWNVKFPWLSSASMFGYASMGMEVDSTNNFFANEEEEAKACDGLIAELTEEQVDALLLGEVREKVFVRGSLRRVAAVPALNPHASEFTPLTSAAPGDMLNNQTMEMNGGGMAPWRGGGGGVGVPDYGYGDDYEGDERQWMEEGEYCEW